MPDNLLMRRREFLMGSLACALSNALHGQVLEKDGDIFRAGLILRPGPPGRCDDYRIGGPVVRWDAAQQQWRMWYYCRDSGFPADLAPAFGSGSIATALSRDGFSWERVDGPLAGGAVFTPSDDPLAFDSAHVATGDVIHDGHEWIMAYFGGNDEIPAGVKPLFKQKGYVLRPGIARSKDGVNWRRVPGQAYGGAALDVHPGDVYSAFPGLLHTGGRFLLYYTTVDKEARYWRQRVAISADGSNWTPHGDLRWDNESRLFDAGGIISRDILRNPFSDDPPWLMVYTAKDGRDETGGRRSIGAAVSEDALTWRRLLHHPVFVTGPEGAWDHAGVAVPRLIATDQDVRLYYYGWSDDSFEDHPYRGIGCAVAPFDSPWTFKRYQPTP